MRCVRCGTELMEGDRFCPECGAKQEADQTVKDSIPTACPSCGAPITPEMRFCQQCGSPLREAAKSASSANNGSVVTESVDSATTESMAAESWGVDSADDGKKSPTATYPAQPMPDSPELSSAMDEWSESADADAGGKRNRNIVIAVIAALVVVALVAVGIVMLVGHHGQSVETTATTTVSNPGKTEKRAKSNAKTEEKQSKDCAATPDASLSGVSASGSVLIATVDFSARACGDTAWKGKNVKISVKDSDNEVIASAVYDFTNDPVRFENGEATRKLAYTTGQYWRASDQIRTSTTTMVVQGNSPTTGFAAGDVNGAKGGAKIAESDVERYAQQALSWQLDHDRSAVSALYDTPTTQLSSKKYDMEVDGKTWKYNDIYAQYLELRAKWPRTVLAWASDYDYYTRNGYASDYYVILSGETFGSKEEGRAWCSENGFGSNDCMAIALD